MARIMLLNYIAGAGKDSIASYLEREYDFKQYALADKVHEIAREAFGMKKKDRELLINVGEKMCEIDKLVWIKETLRRIEKDGHEHVVISDVRKLLEFSYLQELGFIPVMVYCDQDVALERLRKRDDTIKKDVVVYNKIENQLRFLKDHTHVIDNSHTWAHTEQQLTKFLANHDIEKKSSCEHKRCFIYMTSDEHYIECEDCGKRRDYPEFCAGRAIH